MSKLSQRQAMVSYFNSLLTTELEEDSSLAKDQLAQKNQVAQKSKDSDLKPELKAVTDNEVKTAPLAVREDRREELQQLLDTVPAHTEPATTTTVATPLVETITQTEVEVVTQTPVAPQTQIETVTETQTETALATQTQTKLEVATETVSGTATATATVSETETTTSTATAPMVEAANEAPVAPVWENLKTESEFTALFFKVAGITLAVPLVNLGGIYEPGTITSLFGKPDWYMGLMQLGDSKVSVVDTQKWMLPDVESPTDRSYTYVIMLDKSEWCIGCDELIGTKMISRSSIKWREQPGARPWLAGIVKDDMCALIHVEELMKIFRQGLDMCKE